MGTAPTGNWFAKTRWNKWFQNCFFPSRVRLEKLIEKRVQYHGGAWQKIVFVVLADKSLRVENVFECVVKLPDTPYTVRRTMLYTPSKFMSDNFRQNICANYFAGNPMVMASASNSSPARSLCWINALLWFTSFLIKFSRVSWPASGELTAAFLSILIWTKQSHMRAHRINIYDSVSIPLLFLECTQLLLMTKVVILVR